MKFLVSSKLDLSRGLFIACTIFLAFTSALRDCLLIRFAKLVHVAQGILSSRLFEFLASVF